MKQKYVLTAVAVVAVGAVVLGTVPMWEGTNSVKQEETRTSIIEDPVNTETEETGTPTPLPTTAPVTGISHTDSYEDLYAQVKEWQNNSSYSNVQPRIMTVEESADAAGTDSAASNSSMAATMPEEPIDQEYGFDPSSEGKDYSTTTTQEELIDEADIVKTDGSCIYAMDSKGTLRIADAASMKLLCEINGENSSDYKEMYVDGNCLQLICQQEDYITYKGSIDLPSANAGGEKNTDGVRTSYSMPVTTVTVETYDISDREKPKKTGVYHQDGSYLSSRRTDGVRTSYSMPVTTVTVETYDISDREKPKKTGVYHQDGSYLSSRRTDGRMYLFTSYTPEVGDSADQLQYYVPRCGEEYIAYDHIYLPTPEKDFSYNGRIYLVAGAVAQENPDQATDVMAVVSSANIFYVSENNIYSATEIWNDRETRTEIVRIGYRDGKFTDGAAGSVAGELHNNFSMNEADDCLRIVTTVEGWDKDYSNFSRSNGLYVLNEKLKTIGKIEDLAEGEQIKAARFMGDIGYFVTYRNTDPLFAADLSDPKDPRIMSELNITGFSEYLHFYGENQLLGIGWETDPDTGNVTGMKCSMFDISDPSDVRETDRFILKDVSFCDALYNYHAILAAPKKSLFGFAYGIYGDNTDVYDSSENYYYALLSYHDQNGFEPQMYLNINDSELFAGSMSYQDYCRVRGVYIGDMFYLVTEKGIVSYNIQKDYEQTGTLKWEA